VKHPNRPPGAGARTRRVETPERIPAWLTSHVPLRLALPPIPGLVPWSDRRRFLSPTTERPASDLALANTRGRVTASQTRDADAVFSSNATGAAEIVPEQLSQDVRIAVSVCWRPAVG
jgi:hypothetical protein